MAEELKPLAGPYEIFELSHQEVREFRVVKWQLGTMRIETAEEPAGKTVKALRVYVTAASKPIGVNWWDVTSQTLIAQILPELELPGFEAKLFTVTKYGERPKARFTVKVT